MNGHDAGNFIQLVEGGAFQTPFEGAQVGPARDEPEVLLGQIPVFPDRFDGDGQGAVQIHFWFWSHPPMNPK